ncbi:MAG TPA: hypothetical protein VGO00_20450, partial [Kofleriaceae bacterium]|nr:hypothetical protein [Kofleriaceae bacterium]
MSDRDDVDPLEAQRLLDNVEIASPCRADWNAMTGDDRMRHCGSCDKQVFNISAMTRDEATALLRDKAGLCLRYYQRADGTILLADCTIGRRRRRLRIVGSALLAAGAGLALAVHVAPDEPSALSVDRARPLSFDELPHEPHHFELGGSVMGASRALEFTSGDERG